MCDNSYDVKMEIINESPLLPYQQFQEIIHIVGVVAL